MISNGARYMKTCFRDLIKPARVNCVHIVCLAHCLNLAGEVVRKNFPIVDTFMAHTKTAFRLSFGKRKVYIDYLQRAGIEKPLSPPIPILIRWYSWFEAVVQHNTYFEHFQGKINMVQEEFGE